MIASRSCPFSCSFCFHPTGNVYRERSLDDFFAELDFLVKKYSLTTVFVIDEYFAARMHLEEVEAMVRIANDPQQAAKLRKTNIRMS
jgi:Fe-S oxidoreductase